MEKIPRWLIRWLCLGAVSVTRIVVPARAATCRFSPTCSTYALEAIARLPLHRAALKIVWRICRCNPFSRGGYDPVVD